MTGEQGSKARSKKRSENKQSVQADVELQILDSEVPLLDVVGFTQKVVPQSNELKELEVLSPGSANRLIVAYIEEYKDTTKHQRELRAKVTNAHLETMHQGAAFSFRLGICYAIVSIVSIIAVVILLLKSPTFYSIGGVLAISALANIGLGKPVDVANLIQAMFNRGKGK